MIDLSKVTRFEVIDHRKGGGGRVFIAGSPPYNEPPIKVELSVQDRERTLKVFVQDRDE